MKILLTYNVEYEVGLNTESLTPAKIEEISAQQSIHICSALFYLLRQVAIGAPHNPLFKFEMLLSTIEALSLIGEGISRTAGEHVERLSHLQQGSKRTKK